MFNKGYAFILKEICTESKDSNIVAIRKYSFVSPENEYIVEVEQYQHEVYAIKYYLAKDVENPRKYRTLCCEFKAHSIIRTCMDIMLSIFQESPKASFGFIGSNRYNPEQDEQETLHNTQRFRIYKYAMEQYIGPQSFQHAEDRLKSRYVLINRQAAVEEVYDYVLHSLNESNPDGD